MTHKYGTRGRWVKKESAGCCWPTYHHHTILLSLQSPIHSLSWEVLDPVKPHLVWKRPKTYHWISFNFLCRVRTNNRPHTMSWANVMASRRIFPTRPYNNNWRRYENTSNGRYERSSKLRRVRRIYGKPQRTRKVWITLTGWSNRQTVNWNSFRRNYKRWTHISSPTATIMCQVSDVNLIWQFAGRVEFMVWLWTGLTYCLSPGRSGYYLRCVNSKHKLRIDILCIQVNIALEHWVRRQAITWTHVDPDRYHHMTSLGHNEFIHWGGDKMATIFQTTFSNALSWMKMYEIHWSLFLRFQLTINQHWFR